MGQQLFLPGNQITVEEADIQGDILIGLQKKAEIFAFFEINDSTNLAPFRAALGKLAGQLATTKETRRYEKLHGSDVVKINVALSAAGLKKLGAPGLARLDKSFLTGMPARAAALEDNVAKDWLKPFTEHVFDGVILIAAWDKVAVTAMGLAQAKANSVSAMFGASMTIVHREEGILNANAPGHEAFGFADGVSQPGVDGLHRPMAAADQSFAGQDLVVAGDFVFGDYDIETGGKAIPPVPWMRNGSYLVFRRLQQHVTVFDDYVANNYKGRATDPDQFGARLFGRWKDGSPLARDPVQPNRRHDETRPRENNDFEFGIPVVGQSRCPFNGHIRRVYPRSDIQQGKQDSEKRRIMRAGIAYDQSKGTTDDRGLLFVCYQTSIEEKFEFIQIAWANQTDIPFDPPYPAGLTGKKPQAPGVDLIIGQGPAPRDADWTVDKAGPQITLTSVPKFVTATGGGYFFSPSISALKWFGGVGPEPAPIQIANK